ncbi:MAG: single-stranded DNA-binding protein [Ktedonobacteraceae bacterium]|nr:single-stranded DNA-binding protein [Ktedonobacteraceae bacterium]MBV9615664.1 single-stranded DNA-binding protein [Ktedonobacteraceae bacterium]
MNKIILVGNLGRDPEMSYTPNGMAVTKFSLAVNRVTKSQSGERQEETDWYNITAWGKQAETCNTILKKGQKLYVDGRFTPRKYVDRSGAERISFDVTVNDFEILSSKDPHQGGSSGFVGGNIDENDALGDLDDHPF